jgi:hypothetical protein
MGFLIMWWSILKRSLPSCSGYSIQKIPVFALHRQNITADKLLTTTSRSGQFHASLHPVGDPDLLLHALARLQRGHSSTKRPAMLQHGRGHHKSSHQASSRNRLPPLRPSLCVSHAPRRHMRGHLNALFFIHKGIPSRHCRRLDQRRHPSHGNMLRPGE